MKFVNTRRIIFAALLFAAFIANADIPNGYYNSAYNLSKADLKTALHKIINPHQQVSSYSALPDYFKKTDVRPNTSYWWDMYCNLDVDISIRFGTYMNREHSLPKSWWGGDENIPAYVDLNHLYPGEAKANQAKSNYPLGVVTGTPSFDNGVSTIGTGVNSGGAAKVFEPANEYKGDFARTYFYMVTCYQNMNWKTTWQVANGTYPSLQQWAIELLLKWHREDPVSQKEQLRNEAVYKIQNNRNPFIDYPDLAEHIWGNKMNIAWNPSSSTTPTEKGTLTAPINGMTLDFGEVALGKTITKQMLVKGNDLSGTLNFIIAQNQCKYFSIPGTAQLANGATRYQISASAAGSESGTWVTIDYTPDELGEHQASGTITGGGQEGSTAFFLSGQCLPVPSLSAPANPTAGNISSTSYIASWDAPSDEIVDYWVITRRIYNGSSVTVKEEIAESNQHEISDFGSSDYETFSVHSVRLGCTSPESETVVVRYAAIDRIDSDMPLVIESHPGFLRIRCSSPVSALTVYDITGRLITHIDGPLYDYSEFSLPQGVYIIKAPEHRRPLKAIAR